MRELRFFRAFEFWDDALRENFPEFDAPLVERIDVPNCALSEYRVFVKRYQLAEGFRCESLSEDCVRWPITLEHSVRHKPLRRSLRSHLFFRFAECQSFGLRKDVCDQHIVVSTNLIQRLRKRNEVARDQPGSLVDE